MTANYRHIRFEEIQGFTVCRSNHGGAVLGRVEWHARWKEHEFIPEPDTAYTIECLRDMADFLGKMNAARKANIGVTGVTTSGRNVQ
jgi:hypothetical protein